jgi:hypothetical protein
MHGTHNVKLVEEIKTHEHSAIIRIVTSRLSFVKVYRVLIIDHRGRKEAQPSKHRHKRTHKNLTHTEGYTDTFSLYVLLAQMG